MKNEQVRSVINMLNRAADSIQYDWKHSGIQDDLFHAAVVLDGYDVVSSRKVREIRDRYYSATSDDASILRKIAASL